MDKSQKGLAGEFYVLAQLTHRGLIATLTLGNAKSVDILATNHDLNELYKVEVKCTDRRPRKSGLFGTERFFMWTLSKKHEEIDDPRLVYCFVCLNEPSSMPDFFLVPSSDVAQYVKWQHDYWLTNTGKTEDKSSVRIFRIPEDDPGGYRSNWRVFGLEANIA